MTWLARLSLTNRAIVGLVTVLLLAVGAISAGSIRQELLPSLDVPVITVVTPYAGASPEVVEQQVTDPIEAAVAGVEGLDATSSTSTGGSSVVTLNLVYGTDITDATAQVERAIAGAALPADVTPKAGSLSTDQIPVVQLAVSSSLPADQAAAVLRDRVQPLLAGLGDVGDVSLSGIRTPRATIDLDTAAAAQKGVSPAAVSALLQANGLRIPAGELTPDSAPTTVEVGSPITAIEQLGDLYLTPDGAGSAPGAPAASGGAGSGTAAGSTRAAGGTAAGGTAAGSGATSANRAPVRLGDIATITAEPAPATGYTRTDGVDSIGIGVTKVAGGNTIAVSDAIHDALPEISDLLGGSAQQAKVTVVFDQAPFIQQSVEDLTTEGLLGLLFAVLVILGFLLSVRATLVTAVSIPLSVLLALIVLYLGGFTLNILTLGALTVAVGRVVDDSIVVIENIKRHIGYGGPRRPAILTAIREVAGAITASTITTVAVFAPIGFVGGQVGELFRPFAVTVSAALLASLFVSLTVVPVLASLFLRSPAVPAHAEPAVEEKPTALQRSYLPVLRAALARPVVSVLIAVALLLGTGALVPLLRTNFIGNSGGDTLTVTQELDAGTALPRADAAAKQVETVLADTDGVDSYQVTVGSPSGGSTRFGPPSSVSAAATHFSITLGDGADGTSVADDLRRRLDDLAGAGALTVSEGQGGVGSSQLAVDVQADDTATLTEAAQAVETAVAGIPGASDVRNDLAAEQKIVDVAVDRRKAAEQGLTEAAVGQTVAAALRGSTVGTLTFGGVEQDVVLRTGTAPADLAALRALPVGTGTLGDIAIVAEVTTAPSISHTDGKRSAQITARPSVDDLGAVTADLRKKLDDLDLPEGATAVVGGVSQEQGDAFAQLGLALLAAIAMVYLVMVVTFRSLLQPLVLLVAIPFAATGALGLLLITGTPLGVPSLIGMLMLVGIVVTNAIVLIDLVNQYRRDGRPLYRALLDGAGQRLRPILMTAVATIFALLPMAFGLTGGGGFISQPLAVVVIGGLVSSTLLTLVLVPVLYLLAERGRERRRVAAAESDGSAVSAAGAAGGAHAAGVWAASESTVPDGTPVPAGAVADRAPPGRVGSEDRWGAGGAHAGPAGDPRQDRAQDASSTANGGSSNGVGSGTGPIRGMPPILASANGSGSTTQPVGGHRVGAHSAVTAPVVPVGSGAFGVVTDRDGHPLPDIALTVFDTAGAAAGAAVVDARGHYSVDLPGPEEYLLVGQSGGREPAAEWMVGRAGPVRRDLTVEGPAGVTGRVRAADGTGVAALVSLIDMAGSRVDAVRTSADGRFLLVHVPAGEHRLLVSPTSGPSTSVRVRVPESGLVTQDVDLASTGIVGDAVGTVIDADGRIVATGVRLAGLPTGSYTVTTTRPTTPG